MKRRPQVRMIQKWTKPKLDEATIRAYLDLLYPKRKQRRRP